MSLNDVEKSAHVDDATIRMVMERVRNSEHKRNMPPIVSLYETLL
jgi:NAD+ synthase